MAHAAQIACLLIRLASIVADPALGSRGDRKIVTTTIRATTERKATSTQWTPPGNADEKCPILLKDNIEMATFTEKAKQARHKHMRATEVYIPLQGNVRIEVEGEEHSLSSGDVLVVNPGAFHTVRREGEFVCLVVACNSEGASDRCVE